MRRTAPRHRTRWHWSPSRPYRRISSDGGSTGSRHVREDDRVTGFEVSGVHKAFRAQRVLRGVDLTIETGTLTAILGASGSGKTTLLRILAGFERVDRGTVTM